MGCCISKCKPKTKPQLNTAVGTVEDKLVISQSSRPSTPSQSPPPLKWKASPPSLTSVSNSFASCSTQSISSTCGSSSLSSATSISFSKVGRTFSNDFLQSCALEHPQIIGLDPIKKIGVVKHHELVNGITHKRARAGSPTLTRHKSFRIEKERLASNGRSISTMRSPSPSRRFNQNNTSYCQRQPMMLSMNTRNESHPVVKGNTRPNRNVIKERPSVVNNKQKFGYHEAVGGSKVEVADQVLSRMSYAAMEDLDNPHIALDCFIFL